MNEDIRKNEEIHEDDLESVSGGIGLLARSPSGLAENEANAQKDMSIGAVPGKFCPKCGFKMQPTVPIQGIVSAAPGFVCTTCGFAQ